MTQGLFIHSDGVDVFIDKYLLLSKLQAFSGNPLCGAVCRNCFEKCTHFANITVRMIREMHQSDRKLCSGLKRWIQRDVKEEVKDTTEEEEKEQGVEKETEEEEEEEDNNNMKEEGQEDKQSMIFKLMCARVGSDMQEDFTPAVWPVKPVMLKRFFACPRPKTGCWGRIVIFVVVC